MCFWYYLQFFNLTLKNSKAKIENLYFSTRNWYILGKNTSKYCSRIIVGHVDDGPTSNVNFSGIWTRIAKKPYNFVIFQGARPCPPSVFFLILVINVFHRGPYEPPSSSNMDLPPVAMDPRGPIASRWVLTSMSKEIFSYSCFSSPPTHPRSLDQPMNWVICLLYVCLLKIVLFPLLMH